MPSLNHVQLIGYLGKEPTIVTMPKGQLATISVATSHKYYNKASCEPCEETQWHRVMLFGKLVELAVNYLQKGALVYISGHLKTDSFVDKSGITRYSTSIIAKQCQLLKPASSNKALESNASVVMIDETSF